MCLYDWLPPDITPLLFEAITSPQSRTAVLIMRFFFLWDLRDWRGEQIHDFHILCSELQDIYWAAFEVCWETWGTSCFVQRLFIVGPAVLFHGYFYIIPMTRRLLKELVRKLRRRWRAA
ncbi:hypothetical protein C8R43DRAFT_1122687 [Mycena crocata]|nr:hypothetical protein C8R43DRAFT_1122687 [Mycena crocata]